MEQEHCSQCNCNLPASNFIKLKKSSSDPDSRYKTCQRCRDNQAETRRQKKNQVATGTVNPPSQPASHSPGPPSVPLSLSAFLDRISQAYGIVSFRGSVDITQLQQGLSKKEIADAFAGTVWNVMNFRFM